MINKRTNCHMLYQYAIITSRPDRQCVKKQQQQQKKTPVPIVALFVSYKGEMHSRSYSAEQIKLSTRSTV